MSTNQALDKTIIIGTFLMYPHPAYPNAFVISSNEAKPLCQFAVTSDGITLSKAAQGAEAMKMAAAISKEINEHVIPVCDEASYIRNTIKMGYLGRVHTIAAIFYDVYTIAMAQRDLKAQAQSQGTTSAYAYYGTFGASIVKGNADSTGVVARTGVANLEIVKGLQELGGEKKHTAVDLDKKLRGIKPNFVGGFILALTSKINLTHIDMKMYAQLRG